MFIKKSCGRYKNGSGDFINENRESPVCPLSSKSLKKVKGNRAFGHLGDCMD